MTDPEQGRFRITPIGVVHSAYETSEAAPNQGFADDSEATLEVFEAYADELAGIGDVLRLTVVYWAHEVDRSTSTADGAGVFARRGPARPNPLSICTCAVFDVDGRRISVGGLDAVDGSPLIDLKPALQAER